MSSGGRVGAPTGSVRSSPDVVAGLIPGAPTARIARLAVREATALGARVRFVQVLESKDTSTHSGAAGGEVDTETFGAVLSALRGVRPVPVSFEVASGPPGPALVERSRNARLLVVGAPNAADTTTLVRYCEEHGSCPVAVPIEASSARTATRG